MKGGADWPTFFITKIDKTTGKFETRNARVDIRPS